MRLKLTPTNFWGWLALCWLLAGVCVVRAERLPLRPYTTANGLAHDRTRCLARTGDGFLWVGTAEGLSRFDGYRFINYGLENGLPSATVSAVWETRNGWLWVGTDNGAARLRLHLPEQTAASRPLPQDSRPQFTAFRVGDKLLNNQVSVLYEDSAARLWAGTLGGLFLWDETAQRFQAVPDKLLSAIDNLSVTAISEDLSGSLWFATWQGVFQRRPDGHFVRFALDNQPGKRTISWRHLVRSPDGLLFFLDKYGLIAFRPDPARAVPANAPAPWQTLNTRYDEMPAAYQDFAPGEARFYTSRQAEGLNNGLRLCQTADGRLWVATEDEGVWSFEQGRFRRYGPEHGLADNFIVDVIDDRAGNIWLATFRNGIQKWGRNGFTSYSREDGLQHSRVVTIFAGPGGTVCASADEWAVGCADAHRVTEARLNVPANLAWTFTLNALRDHTGAWWTPVYDSLYRFPAVPPAQLAKTRPNAVYTRENGLPPGRITELFEDTRGDLWFSAGDTTARWERARNTFHAYNDIGLPAQSHPSAFAEDATGAVWAGGNRGALARYRDGQWRAWGEADGFPAGVVRDLHFDQAGRLWIATSLGGLVRVDKPQADKLIFQTYTTAQGLAGNNVRCLTTDKFGRVYLGVGRGVDRLSPDSGRIKHYTTADGLPNSFVNAAYRDAQGDLWFGMLQGLARFTPEMDAPDAPVPVFLSGLRVNGVPYLASDLGLAEVSGPEVASGSNQVQFDFFGLSFAVGEELRYQYKFEGLPTDWSAPTEQRSVQASLAPGRYRFLVRAVNADGTAGEPARVTLRVLPPVWQRWWFIALVLLSLGGLVWVVERYRTRRLRDLLALQRAEEALSRSRAERLTDIERVRRRIATDLHDDIGSSLTQISIMSEVLRQRLSPEGARTAAAPLNMMAEASRELVDSLSDIVWAINPQKDHLSDLVQRMRRFASDLLTARNIRFRLELPLSSQDVQLGANVRRELFMIFKESLNNLVKHSRCTEADIVLECTPGGLRLTICDNGQGFDPGSEFDGYGLSSMRGRAGELGGTLSLDSVPGQGTTIRLAVPLERAPEGS